MKSVPNLRRLIMNGDCFEVGRIYSSETPSSTEQRFRARQAYWATDASGNVVYMVKQVDASVRLFSWEQGWLDGKPTAITLLD